MVRDEKAGRRTRLAPLRPLTVQEQAREAALAHFGRDRLKEMQAFDALPPLMQRAIKSAPQHIDATKVLMALRAGMDVITVLREIRDGERFA